MTFQKCQRFIKLKRIAIKDIQSKDYILKLSLSKQQIVWIEYISEIQFVDYIQGILPTIYLAEGYDESKFFVNVKEEKHICTHTGAL